MSTADHRSIRKSLRTNFAPGPRDYLNRAVLRARQAVHLPALWMGGELDRPIFIVGAPRSGTSILYSVLRSSPQLAHWPGEAHEVWEAEHHPALRGWESNVLTRDDATDATADRIRRSFFLVTGPRRRLIDKTPRNALRVAFVDAIFPDARYVFLYRDGRDNVNSLLNAWRTPRYRTYELPERHSLEGVDPRWWKFVLYPGWREDLRGPLEVVCAKQWVFSNDLALDARGILEAPAIADERWIPLRYEDMVEYPVEAIERVAVGLGIPVDSQLRGRAAAVATTPVNVVTPPERGKWRRENPTEIDSILELIAPTMARLGYSTDAD